jgi:hypothetical protein
MEMTAGHKLLIKHSFDWILKVWYHNIVHLDALKPSPDLAGLIEIPPGTPGAGTAVFR